MFEAALEKKRKYISMQNLEQAQDIIEFVFDTINKVRNEISIDSIVTNKNVSDAIRQFFYGRNYNSPVKIVDSSLFESGCKHRVDISIEAVKQLNYRFLILSCDGRLQIQNVIPVYKNIDETIRMNEKALKLFVSMFDVKSQPIGNLTIKAAIAASGDPGPQLIITGTLTNLIAYENKKLGLHVHTTGDLTNQCKACGMHYNPFNQFHGGTSGERHLGDFGNINVDGNGLANIDTTVTLPMDLNLKLPSVLGMLAGRSLVLHDKEDDLGKGNNNESAINGNSGSRIACGVIGGEFISSLF